MSIVCSCDCEPVSENYTYNTYNYNSMPVSYDENDNNIVKCLQSKGVNSNFDGKNPKCNDQCILSGCTNANSVCTDYCNTDMNGYIQPHVDIDPETCKIYGDLLQNKPASCDSIQDINTRERCKSDLYELMHNIGTSNRCDSYLNKPVDPTKPIPHTHKKPIKPQPSPPQPVNPINSDSVGYFSTTGGKIVIGVTVVVLIALLVFIIVYFSKRSKRQNLRFY